MPSSLRLEERAASTSRDSLILNYERIRIKSGLTVNGNLRESDYLHPVAGSDSSSLQKYFGDVWEWTASAYAPYPGYRVPTGTVGEYNGKFMSSQTLMRGGSCVTPPEHVRNSYCNFFYPKDRWQFSGIRVAQDL